LSDICEGSARCLFTSAFDDGKIISPYASWERNRDQLSKIPAHSDEAKKLLGFLKRRWLAKVAGFAPAEVRWICPNLGISVQANPVTTNCYARDPGSKRSAAYENRVLHWKKTLPQPLDFPLFLTRPFDLCDFLPSHVSYQGVEEAVEKAKEGLTVVDLTDEIVGEREEWLALWEPLKSRFLQVCLERDVDPGGLLCIQRCMQEEIGGIRILPLNGDEKKQEQFLLDWISHFGLSATQIEIDRWPSVAEEMSGMGGEIPSLSVAEFASYLEDFHCVPLPGLEILLQGTLQVLRGLVPSIESGRVRQCPTRSKILGLSLFGIKEELEQLKGCQGPFFKTATHIEQIHAHLSSLLEICSPFSIGDFPSLYAAQLHAVPPELKQLASYAIHNSGMASVGGLLRAAEKSLGSPPRVLYGENTYFECVIATSLRSRSRSVQEATEEDWREADLIFLQFNPVWRRDAVRSEGYQSEEIALILRRCLERREGKPLTLALDSTLDAIDSSRAGKVFEEFQEEIQKGTLNIACYRSGLKFDVFGMDNYCGAPFFLIHNRDPKWDRFDALLSDPVLLADRLSVNWFCLAYAHAADQLELYRKQISSNTRALLDQIPDALYDPNGNYRVIPVQAQVEPSFLDFHVYGPFHLIRAAALVCGLLYLRTAEQSHPMFYRRSLGFYHLNFGLLFGKTCSTIRLTLGLDPVEVGLLGDCFRELCGLSPESRHADASPIF